MKKTGGNKGGKKIRNLNENQVGFHKWCDEDIRKRGVSCYDDHDVVWR